MTTAYSDTYLSGAQRRLGAMLDTAVHGCDCRLEDFYRLFLAHPLAVRFGAGDPSVVAGRSGEELAFEVMGEVPAALAGQGAWRPRGKASREYWTGWALAFYQWASGAPFHVIQERVAVEEVRALYRPYHEMDIRQFCDRMDELSAAAHPRTNLQERRLSAGLSQSQLALAAGVPVRTLQQYEQRQKDINHARADYVESLARALCCAPSDLMERRAAGVEYAAIAF